MSSRFPSRCSSVLRLTSSSPEAFEVNTGRCHFTIYRERQWGIFNLEDERRGECTPMDQSNIEWNCPKHDEFKGRKGRLVFACRTTDYDARHFN
ncbi:hypothetical protein PG985_000155 [Apiospora marii]|uniref:Uncharacterized protein n=1 Tax=Apiospora marii TaxID=335849 RepID=A0ABR1R1E2_9PEZI